MEFHSAYSERVRHSINFGKDSRTKQAHKDETDINQIMAKYIKTGVLEHANKYDGQYGFATSHDLHSALNLIQTAQEMFDELPSSVRSKMDNDPAKFLEFVQDPENAGELYELGLSLTAPENPTPQKEPVGDEKPQGEGTGTPVSADAIP